MTGQVEISAFVDKAALRRRIERLDTSADIKVLLDRLLEGVLAVGERVIQVGARVVQMVLDFARAYPGITLGVCAALVIAYLINSIPLLGPMLSPVLTPLLLIIGIGLGALNDMTEGPVQTLVEGFARQLREAGVR
jgi:hypothetical protein